MSYPPEKKTVSIVDLGIQNIHSVENAYRTIGADVRIVTTVTEAEEAQFLVLPGVGAYSRAVEKLSDTGLDRVIRRHAIEKRRPLLGLCLGMQLLADASEEFGCNEGLGLIKGRVIKLIDQPPQFRVPNIGWREVRPTGNSGLLPDGGTCAYYHVHSFHFKCDNVLDVAATTHFGTQNIASIVHRGNVVGAQFHPEKSQEAGLNMLHFILHNLK